MREATKKIVVLAILYLGFISLGLPDQVLGIAWPEMRTELARPLDNAGLLVAIYSIFSGLAGFLSGYFISRFTVTRIVIASTFLTVIGLLGYGFSQNWLLALIASVPFGLGAGAIDSALNNYVAMNYSPKHMNWLHGFWGIGATLGPVILTSMLAFGLSWRVGYMIIASIQFMIVVIFVLTRHLWRVQARTMVKQKRDSEKTGVVSVDTFLSALFFLFYVAVEAGIGLWYYSFLVNGKGVTEIAAGIFISFYWCSLMVGRFVTGKMTEQMANKNIITGGIYLALVAMILLTVNSEMLNFGGLLLMGFALSGLYPCMMNVAHKRFKTEVAQVLIGHQVGAACFGFVIPLPLIGFLMQRVGLWALIPTLFVFVICLLAIDSRLRRLDIDVSRA